jgi:hypothetical protein
MIASSLRKSPTCSFAFKRAIVACLIGWACLSMSTYSASARNVVLLVSASGFCIGENYKDKYKEVDTAFRKAIANANSRASYSGDQIDYHLEDMQCNPAIASETLRRAVERDKAEFVFMWSISGLGPIHK